MGKVHDGIDDRLRSFIEAQQVFFVGTAPSGSEGHVNVSPKGLADTFRVVDDHTVAYLDLTASGAETIPITAEIGVLALERLAPVRLRAPQSGPELRRRLRLCLCPPSRRAAALQGRGFHPYRHQSGVSSRPAP